MKCQSVEVREYDSDRNEILDLVEAYQAGLIYTLAPKHYVLLGFEYYRLGRVLR